jgi:hypothetical protein
MVQIDIPVAFGTAGVFAAAVEQGLKSERRSYFYQRALAVSLIFQLFLVVWLPVYLLVAHFGFQTSHMWWTGDSITDYPWLLPAFLAAYFAACIGGFHVGSMLVTRGRRKMVWLLFAGGFAFFGAWMAFQPYRTLTLGSYEQWQAQTAEWIWKTPSFVSLLTGAMVVFFIALRIVYKTLQREAAAQYAVTSGFSRK